MMVLAAFLAPFALLFPAVAGEEAVGDPWPTAVAPEGPPLIGGFAGDGRFGGGPLAEWTGGFPEDSWDQVRIEQRLIIRIAPRAPGRDSLAPPPPPPGPMRLRERKSAHCVPVAGIAGVQRDVADRLVLFMRDRRIIGASLDKSCNARDFYLGFYVEQTADGMLCAGRDTIHSRAGATCEISRMRELVPEN